VNQADHTSVLDDEFVSRFGVVGGPEVCLARLAELVDLGLERFVVTGATFGADPTAARLSSVLIRDELLPALRSL